MNRLLMSAVALVLAGTLNWFVADDGPGGPARVEIEVLGNKGPNRWSSQQHDSPPKAAIGKAEGRLHVRVKNGDTVLFKNAGGSHGVIFERAKAERAAGVWEVVKGELSPANYAGYDAENVQTTKPKAPGAEIITVRIKALETGLDHAVLFACDPHSVGGNPQEEPMLGALVLDETPSTQPTSRRPLGVSGVVYLDFGEGRRGLSPIDFPVQVDGPNGSSLTVRTDAHGRFRAFVGGPGRYSVRWKHDDWGEGPPVTVDIDARFRHVAPLVIRVPPEKPLVRGTVLLGNGRPAYVRDTLFALEEAASVEVVDKQGTALGAPVRANAAGEFIVAKIPSGAVAVRARAGSGEPILAPLARPADGIPWATPVTLSLANRPPVIQSMRAEVKERAGDQVVLTCHAVCTDADANPVEVRWKSDSPIDTRAAGTIEMRVPRRGDARVHVLATDGKGGYATGTLSLSMSDDKLVQRFVADEVSGFLELKGLAAKEDAERYYVDVDPKGLRATLGEWWAVNGFDAATGGAKGAVRMAFLNHNDLGFGRDMHVLKRENGDVVAYVTNYFLRDAAGKPDYQNELNADLAFLADKDGSAATVCMEYSAIESSPNSARVVKFFAYENGKAGAPRSLFADLDGGGDKYLPNLCLNCHGGAYPTAAPGVDPGHPVDLEASFREFDLATYRYPRFDAEGKPMPRNDPSRLTPNADEEKIAKRLNELVVASNPISPIGQIVGLWYAGGSTTQLPGARPPGWDATVGSPELPGLYRDVIAKSCRTCHVAQSEIDAGISWTTFRELQAYQSLVAYRLCTDTEPMPHARITYRNFHAGNQPYIFSKFSADGWPPLGPCK